MKFKIQNLRFQVAFIIALILMLAAGIALATLTAKCQLKFNIIYTKTDSFAEHGINVTRGVSFTDGNDNNYEADTLWDDTRILTDDANETLDLHDGSLTDAFGDSLTLNKLHYLYIKNTSTDANLWVGGAAATQLSLFTDDVNGVLVLRPLGDFSMSAPEANGIDVTTNADLKLEHCGEGTSSLTYDILILGCD